jgi:hypothetical protein
MIDERIEPTAGSPSTIDELRRDNALWLERHFNDNERKLEVLSWLFRAGILLLLLTAGLLLFTVISR